MRILIATCHRNLVGGTEKYLQTLMPALTNRGHDVGVVYEIPADPQQETIDSPKSTIDMWCLAEYGLEDTLRMVAEWKPDVVFSNGLEATDFESALLDSYRTILYAHNYYGTCPTGQKCHSFPHARPCARKSGLVCLILHYPRRCGGLHPGTMWRMFRRNARIQSRFRDYQAIVVASKHMYREFQRHGAIQERIHLVPLPNPHNAALAHRPRMGPGGRILFVGRLTKLKGVGHLLRAMPQAAVKLGKPLSVTIAGDGPERGKLEALALELNVSAEFVGWIQTHQKADFMREADLLAVPSLWPEPFGLVGIEAGSFGLPAVAYAVGGVPEWLIPGRSGELAPSDPPTVEGLAEAIVRALTDPGHYANLCDGASEMARRFTLDAHLAKLETILELKSTASASAPV